MATSSSDEKLERVRSVGPIIPSTTVIIRIGVLASESGRVALEWTMLLRLEDPGPLPNL